MSSERRYLDPWDIENYLYLRAGPIRRRSVCFDHVLQYGSYQSESFDFFNFHFDSDKRFISNLLTMHYACIW